MASGSHGAFYPRALSDELVFELTLAPASGVVKGSDSTKLGYELTNIQLEFKAIQRKEIAEQVESNLLNGDRFMFEHVTHHKTITIAKGTDNHQQINQCSEKINEGNPPPFLRTLHCRDKKL